MVPKELFQKSPKNKNIFFRIVIVFIEWQGGVPATFLVICSSNKYHINTLHVKIPYEENNSVFIRNFTSI